MEDKWTLHYHDTINVCSSDAEKWNLLCAANGTLGIYPQASHGSYEKRSDWMNGWNAANTQITKTIIAIQEAQKVLTPEQKELLSELVERGIVFWHVNEETKKANPWLLVSDTFDYACADGEDLPYDAILQIYSLWKKFGYSGIAAWTAKQRNREPLKEIQTQEYEEAKNEIHNIWIGS